MTDKADCTGYALGVVGLEAGDKALSIGYHPSIQLGSMGDMSAAGINRLSHCEVGHLALYEPLISWSAEVLIIYAVFIR